MKYLWTCFTASTSRCLACPNTITELEQSITGDQLDSTKSIIVEAGQSTTPLTINPTYTITNNAQTECPRIFSIQFLENSIWKTMSTSVKPAWVTNFAQTNIYTRPEIQVKSSDISLQGTKGYLRYVIKVESDQDLLTYDNFAIEFTNPCTAQTVVLNAPSGSMYVSDTENDVQ